MRIIIVAAVLAVAAASANSWSSRAEPTAAGLTDADAARVVSGLLNQQSYETLLLGNIVVYPDGVSIPTGNNITSTQHSRYKIWASIGVINIVEKSGPTRERSEQSFPQADWRSHEREVLNWITVTPTLKATDSGYYFGTTLKIKMATFKVDYLTQNEERVIGVHTYRKLMGIYESAWMPAFIDFCRAHNACASAEKGKFIVLVKLNDFTRRWDVVAWDVADINREFTTHNVDQQLLSLR